VNQALVLGGWKEAPHWPRLLPFAVFIVLMAAEPWLAGLLGAGGDARWLYGLRTLAAGSLMLLLARHCDELVPPDWPLWREAGLAVAVGLAVWAVWLTLDEGLFVVGHPGSGFDPRRADGSLVVPLALVRWLGAALVVPVIEELFWRSFILRWLDRPDFLAQAPGLVSGRAVLASSLAFGFEHSQWAAGLLAGLAYAWLYRRSGKLWVPILAHGVTNGVLGAWVLAQGQWQYW